MREVNSQPVRGLILQDLYEHETSHVLQFGVLNALGCNIGSLC